MTLDELSAIWGPLVRMDPEWEKWNFFLSGQGGEPVAEKTKLGWFIMSPGQEFDHNRMTLTQTSQTDYEELCQLRKKF